MFALQDGYVATAQLLVEAGADKDTKDKVRAIERDEFQHAHVNGKQNWYWVMKMVAGGFHMASALPVLYMLCCFLGIR